VSAGPSTIDSSKADFVSLTGLVAILRPPSGTGDDDTIALMASAAMGVIVSTMYHILG
jgi:hypothetical protein